MQGNPVTLNSFVVACVLLCSHSVMALDLQGHRGARGLAPENTLPAFELALKLGVDTLELDCGVTKDGVVVIHHDRGLNPDTARGPDGRWIELPGPLIYSTSYEELLKFDVGRIRPGSDYAKRFPDQKPIDGTRIPRLAELFELVKRSGNAAVRFNIETKIAQDAPHDTLPPEPFARALLAEVRKAGMDARTTIQSFDFRTLEVVQREAPAIQTSYLSHKQKGVALPRAIRKSGGGVWSPAFTDVDPGSLAEAHALGLKVVVWTVNERADIRRMLRLGVDGIISDRPDRVRAELAPRRGSRRP